MIQHMDHNHPYYNYNNGDIDQLRDDVVFFEDDFLAEAAAAPTNFSQYHHLQNPNFISSPYDLDHDHEHKMITTTTTPTTSVNNIINSSSSSTGWEVPRTTSSPNSHEDHIHMQPNHDDTGKGYEKRMEEEEEGVGFKIAFRTQTNIDIMDDGFRWRKYGKKKVKNSPNPRSYYQCTTAGCKVKKRVEREKEDPRFVITTYQGKHNHPNPTAATAAPTTAPVHRLQFLDHHQP